MGAAAMDNSSVWTEVDVPEHSYVEVTQMRTLKKKNPKNEDIICRSYFKYRSFFFPKKIRGYAPPISFKNREKRNELSCLFVQGNSKGEGTV